MKQIYLIIIISVFLTGIASAGYVKYNNPGLPHAIKTAITSAINYTEKNVNKSDYWDNLDAPDDITGSEYWYNHTKATTLQDAYDNGQNISIDVGKCLYIFGNETTSFCNPMINIISPENKTYTTTTVDFNVSLNKEGDTCQFNLDDDEYATGFPPTYYTNWTDMNKLNNTYFYYTYSDLADQTRHNITFKCNDTSGEEYTTRKRYFTVDTDFSLNNYRQGKIAKLSRIYPENQNDSFYSSTNETIVPFTFATSGASMERYNSDPEEYETYTEWGIDWCNLSINDSVVETLYNLTHETEISAVPRELPYGNSKWVFECYPYVDVIGGETGASTKSKFNISGNLNITDKFYVKDMEATGSSAYFSLTHATRETYAEKLIVNETLELNGTTISDWSQINKSGGSSTSNFNNITVNDSINHGKSDARIYYDDDGGIHYLAG